MPVTKSPFRYPGGKTQLYSFIANLLKLNSINGTYIEPFAGGAGVAIKLLLENKINNIWINDYDKSIYSVWYSILNNPYELIRRIEDVPFDYKSGFLKNPNDCIKFWEKQRKIYLSEKNNQNSIDLAFSTLFLNRTNTSGIINAGPIGGHDQLNNTKIFARFNKKTLIDKIKAINTKKESIRLTRLDGYKMIKKIEDECSPNNTFIFFDPPYYEQGKNLYFTSFTNYDHLKLSSRILSMEHFKWIVTYDNSPFIYSFYKNNKKNFEYLLNYSANNKKRCKASELLFASEDIMIDSYKNIKLKRRLN